MSRYPSRFVFSSSSSKRAHLPPREGNEIADHLLSSLRLFTPSDHQREDPRHCQGDRQGDVSLFLAHLPPLFESDGRSRPSFTFAPFRELISLLVFFVQTIQRCSATVVHTVVSTELMTTTMFETATGESASFVPSPYLFLPPLLQTPPDSLLIPPLLVYTSFSYPNDDRNCHRRRSCTSRLHRLSLHLRSSTHDYFLHP